MPTISSKLPAPVATTSAAPAPKQVQAPPPPPKAQPTQSTATSSFQPAATSRAPVNLSPSPATTLRTERLGDGQTNCLERANQLARPGDTVVLLADRRDASGHAVVQHRDGSVTDPNLPGMRYPNLASWQAANPQYHQPAGIPQQSLSQVLRTPPGPQRDALIRELGLGGIAGRAVADPPRYYVTPNDGGLRVRARPNTDESNAPLVTVPEGQVLTVTGGPNAEGWAPVSYLPAGSDTPITGYAMIVGNTAPVNKAEAEASLRAQEVYVHQTDAEKQVISYVEQDKRYRTGDGVNGNCGPSSLVMAFRLEGLELPSIPGIVHNGSDGADVQAARFAMYGAYDTATPPADPVEWARKDGVVEVPNPNGGPPTYQYADMRAAGGENSQYTGFIGVHRAVRAADGYSEDILARPGETMNDAILRQLEAGRTVIVVGDFTVPEQRPKKAGEGERSDGQGNLVDDKGNVVMETIYTPKTDTWARGGGATRHLVTIAGTTGNAEDGTLRFIVNDPIHPSKGPILVTPEQLASFMNVSNPGAVAIGGPDDPALQRNAATGTGE